MVSPDSGGGNSGFRCASGDLRNEDKGREIAIEGVDASAEGMSQDKLQVLHECCCDACRITWG